LDAVELEVAEREWRRGHGVPSGINKNGNIDIIWRTLKKGFKDMLSGGIPSGIANVIPEGTQRMCNETPATAYRRNLHWNLHARFVVSILYATFEYFAQ
jgi:hypothetical protein